MGFVEYYPWNLRSHIYGGLPHMDVKFGVPSSKTDGLARGPWAIRMSTGIVFVR